MILPISETDNEDVNPCKNIVVPHNTSFLNKTVDKEAFLYSKSNAKIYTRSGTYAVVSKRKKLSTISSVRTLKRENPLNKENSDNTRHKYNNSSDTDLSEPRFAISSLTKKSKLTLVRKFNKPKSKIYPTEPDLDVVSPNLVTKKVPLKPINTFYNKLSLSKNFNSSIARPKIINEEALAHIVVDEEHDNSNKNNNNNNYCSNLSHNKYKRKSNIVILDQHIEKITKLDDDMSSAPRYNLRNRQLSTESECMSTLKSSPTILLTNEVNQNLVNSTNYLSISETGASIVTLPPSKNSIATLCNIGNSCYLNSVLYTLRFAPLFLHKLHHLIEDMDSVYQKLGQNRLKSSSLGRNVSALHGQSGRSWSSKDLASLGGNGSTNNCNKDHNLPPKTNWQIATEKLHELYQNLHRQEAIDSQEPFHAGNFLQAVQDVWSIFEGNQQQDAHEFLMCLLDSIRETCQSLIKIICDYPDIIANGYPHVAEPIEQQVEMQIPQHNSQLSVARSIFRKRKETVKNPASKPPIKEVHHDASIITNESQTAANLKKNLIKQTTTEEQLFLEKEQLLNDKDKLMGKIKSLGLDFFRDDFEGTTVSTTTCLTCETETEQKETMIDIAIPISGVEVADATKNPQLFFQKSCITKERFCGENKYKCEECGGYTEACRTITFEVLPRLLVLQLKRFSGGMEKINSYIPTPFTLKCFCNECVDKPDIDKRHTYKLYSVITHVGATMSVGHYIAYTSSLDIHSEYINCPKDKRQFLLSSANHGSGATISNDLSSMNNQNLSNSEKILFSLGKKKLFSSKKASSSGDMSKKIKNNVVNKIVLNSLEKLNLSSSINGSANNNNNNNNINNNMNNTSNNSGSNNNNNCIPCQGLNCCGIHLKNSHSNMCNMSSVNGVYHHHNNNSNSDISDTNAISNNSSSSGALSDTTIPSLITQQLWYMCDDDKIKTMSQREFEELLSPTRKNMITPYLLFYARSDSQPPPPTTQPPPQQAT